MKTPAPIVIRPFRAATDYEAFAAIVTATAKADGVPFAPAPETLRIEHEESDQIDSATDMVVAELDGEPVAVAGVGRAVRADVAVFDMWGHVHPSVRRRGIGRQLLDRNLARTAERVAVEPADMPVQGGGFVEDAEVGHRAMLASVGFAPVRYFFLMRQSTLVDIPDVPLPDGIEIRPVTADQHRAIFEAEREAFRDHWGHREAGEDDFRQTFAMPDLNTDLWVVAWDGDEIAGVVCPWIWASENVELGVERGWLESISVRRPWRRRGLGRAITARALTVLRDVGMTEAMLGVDSENPMGALGVYQSVGFEVYSRSAAYRLKLKR